MDTYSIRRERVTRQGGREERGRANNHPVLMLATASYKIPILFLYIFYFILIYIIILYILMLTMRAGLCRATKTKRESALI